ncbi:hypothetical protein [Tuwongella immobilis]|uniref:Uncharacterized protein n=1 Tax=Tuwongella immobilis TaxID=692036 RepID=A0A6C2YVW9_9BACT|nr:hypothetical protein [Tuwongella immobilis]VIP05313.1 unnamed protein product [Tuwongella immobilis]VTS07982.1 unnamed protein product [Tuwongella immobilis]
MTQITLELDQLIEQKYPCGFHVPVHIDLGDFLEFADDDWRFDISLEEVLADQKVAVLTFTAADVRERRPDLTEEQAWEVARIGRDDFVRERCHLDFLECTADGLFPSVKRQALDRVYRLKFSVRERLSITEGAHPESRESTDRLHQWLHELAGIERIARKLPDRITGDPAAEGAIAAALDDLESAIIPNEMKA